MDDIVPDELLSADERVTINDPDGGMLLVGLGLQDAGEPTVFRVGQNFTDVVES